MKTINFIKSLSLHKELIFSKGKTKGLFLIMLSLLAVLQGCSSDDNDEVVVVTLDPIALECDYFSVDRVLNDDPDRAVDYVISCVTKIDANVVINAGVVIEFEDDAGLEVRSNGTLTVQGTSAKKVVFTGVNKVKGAWRGIFFISPSVNNKLDHAVVSYGGGNSFNSNNDRGNVICYSGTIVSITNTEISHGKEHGLNAVYFTEFIDFSNNTITNNDKYPVLSLNLHGHNYNETNSFVGNGMDYVFLKEGAPIGGNRFWSKIDVPYLINGNLGISDNQSLTIEAGAELRFEDEGEIVVRVGAYLAIEGSAENRVLLSGVVEQPGSWLGIINLSDDQRNVINYAEIAYTGGGQHNSNGDLGTIIVWADSYQTVTNTIMRDNASNAPCAINATYGDDTIILGGNTIINIDFELCE